MSASKAANAKYFNSRQFSVHTGKEAATIGHENTLNTKAGTEVNADADAEVDAEAEDDYYVDVVISRTDGTPCPLSHNRT
jgi:hypothetical protein